MTLYTSFRKPHELCTAVQAVAKDEFDKLILLPYNRFDPENSAWWLVPANENPAYKYTKYYFNWGETRRSLRVGIHAEKGLSPEVSSAYRTSKGSTKIMQKDWHWYQFVQNIESGQLPQIIRELTNRLSAPFELRLLAHYCQNPGDFDPHSALGEFDTYVFRFDTASDKLQLTLANNKYQILPSLPREMTLAELAHAIKSFPSNGWVWVNVNITTEFQIEDSDAERKEDAWSESAIWANYLRYFRFIVA